MKNFSRLTFTALLTAANFLIAPGNLFSQVADSITDIRDGRKYHAVQIGDQLWLKQNLRADRYLNNDPIPTGLDNTQWAETTEGAFAIYPHTSIDGFDSDQEVLEAYGALYNWYAVDDDRGLCPVGWKVASDEEWTELVDFMIGQGYPNSNVVNGAGNALKSCRQIDSPLGGDCATSQHPRWNSHNTHYGTDIFGFSALPGGYRSSGGSFFDVGFRGYWWSSTGSSTERAWDRRISRFNGSVTSSSFRDKEEGYSLRCVRDTDLFGYLMISRENFEIVENINFTGGSASKKLFLINQGGDEVTITNIYTNTPEYSTDISPTTLAAGDSMHFTISFNATETGFYDDYLTIESDDPYRPVLQIPLEGFLGTAACGVIAENTTWTKENSPYYLEDCNLAVATGVTLTIDPGVTVIIDPDRQISVDGALIAHGAEGDSITFRDSEGKGFNRLFFRTGSSGELSHFLISGAQTGIRAENADITLSHGRIRNTSTGISLSDAAANISQLTISGCSGYAVYAEGTTSLALTGSILNENQRGVYITGSTTGSIEDCTIANSAGDVDGSGIYLASGSSSLTITGNTFLNNLGSVLKISDNDHKSVANNTFTANALAAHINNADFSGNLIEAGTSDGLLAQNSTISNNTVADNSGYGIQAENSTLSGNEVTGNTGNGINANNSVLIGNTVTGNGGIGINATGYNEITYSTISDNGDDGIRESGNSIIIYCDIIDNGGDGIETSSVPAINYNNIHGNTGYDLRATREGSETIDATNNYWGTAVEDEIADRIYDYYNDGVTVIVDYDPFASEPIQYPRVVYSEVTDITRSSIIISAIVNPNAQETSVYIEYGLTNAYGTTVETEPAVIDGIENQTVTLHLSGLPTGTRYHYRVMAENATGTTYSEGNSFTTAFHYMTDIRDGQRYKVTEIGGQWWFGENLKTLKYLNNDPIPTGLSDNDWQNATEGAFAIYPHTSIDGLDSDEEVLEAYGALYNWYAVDDQRGLCPVGWKIPSNDEWTELTDWIINNSEFTADNVANALKSRRQAGSPLGGEHATTVHPRWNSHSTHFGTDDYGFSALPGGSRSSSGSFSSWFGSDGEWWSSTGNPPDRAWSRRITSSSGSVSSSNFRDKNTGYSLRCMVDADLFGSFSYLIIFDEGYMPVDSLVLAGGITRKKLYLVNQGGEDVDISAVTNNLAEFSVDLSPATLAAGDSLHFMVIFDPGVTESYYSDTLVIESDDPLRPTINIPLLYRPEYPTLQSGMITASNITNIKASLKWTVGNGARRVAFVREGEGEIPIPVDDHRYNASSVFGQGEELSGWYCVYDGTGNSVDISGLTETTSYQVVVFEYNGEEGQERYLATIAEGNPATFTTTLPPFAEVETILEGVSLGSIEWGDFDNDGYLDILLTGDTGSENIAKVYRNNGDGTFTEQAGIALPHYPNRASWGDYNNNGFLDIVVAGFEDEFIDETFTKIYRNNGDGTFTGQSDISITGVASGAVSWGDYNNNGHLDLLVTGHTSDETPITRLYKNNGDDTFTEQTQISLTDLVAGRAAWVDFNNNGYLDIMITGYEIIGYNAVAEIYMNNGDGTFTKQTGISLAGVTNGSIAWGDYNNDGYPDILITGDSMSGPVSKVYRNNGDGTFSEQTEITLPGLGWGPAAGAWGDYDGDGYLDILLSGNASINELVTRIYRNKADGTFSELAGVTLEGVSGSSAAWGDFNNNGRLDFIVSGRNADFNRVTRLYQNQAGAVNTPPTAPSNLQESVVGADVTLSWDRATHDKTPQPGLTYNLYLRRLSDGKVLAAPMSCIETGKRRIAAAGNKWHATSTTYHDLEPGLYAWSVQAVDHSFAGGEFAEEGVFYIPGPPTVVTQATTGVSESTATLNAMVNALGLETTVWFEYGTGEGDHENWETAEADPPTIDGTDETPVSASLDGLQANTYYYFRAAAQNDLGTTYGHDGVLFTSDPPGVTTLDADNIEPFSATLRGSVVPRNLETDVWFEYGLTAEELDNTAGATSSPVDGEYATEVEADIDGLLANEIYYFRVAAESFSGLSEGDIKQFTTAMAAPGAATLAASDITSTSAVLNASVMPHNLTTTVSFEYGKQSGRYDEWESVSTTYSLEGQSSQDVEALVTLEPSTRYYFRVRAENSAGTGYGDQRQLVTLDMAPEVTTKDANDIHRTGATLNGMVNPNNSETSVTFKYGLTDAIDQSWLSADVSGTFDGNEPVAVSVDVIGLDENTQYYFVISATNSGGTSTGEIKGFSTSAPIVAIGDATGITTSSAMLNATVNSNNYAAVYWFEYGTDPQLEQAQTTEPGDIDPGDEELPVIATVTGLEPNTVYYFRVVAESINGRSVSSINELHTDCDWDIICSTPSGPDQLCQGTGSTTFETSSETALEYQWRIEPPGAGSVTGNGETATVTWNSDYSGQASIYVRGYDGVCNSVESDPLVVTINPLPDPALISGDDNVCPGSYGNVYSIEPSEGSSYSWSAVGGTLLEEHDGGFARIHWGDNTDTPRVSVTETIDATGCSRENIMDVIIAGSPAPEKPDIRVKGRIHILISSVNADAYQWFMDNEIIAGATGKYYIAREAAGMYMLRISEGQCHSFSDPLDIPLNKSLYQVEEIGSVFPNPSEGIMTYELSGEVYGLLRIRVTDNSGRVVHTASADKSDYSIKEQINMQNLRSGVYFLEAAVDGEVVDVQVLIKN